MFRFLCLCRSALLVLVLLGILGAGAGLYYLNREGFPGAWGERIESEFARRGLHVEFESLQYSVRAGVVGHGVQFYNTEGKLVMRAEKVRLDVDKTKILRGRFRLRDLDVEGARMFLPVTEKGEPLELSQLSGRLRLTGERRLELKELVGTVRGLQVRIVADVLLPLQRRSEGKEGRENREALIRTVLEELDRWQFAARAPVLDLEIEGDMNGVEKMKTRFSLRAGDLERSGYRLRSLELAGDFQRSVLVFSRFDLADAHGAARGRADWDLQRAEGRFELDSEAHILRMLRVWLGVDRFDRLLADRPPRLRAEGEVARREDGTWSVGLTGRAEIGKFRFLGLAFDRLASDFSWQDGALFLQDLGVAQGEKRLDGRVMMREGVIRYAINSSLPLATSRPFIEKGSQLDQILSQIEMRENSVLAIEAEGTINREKLTEWESRGKAYATNVIYRGVPLTHVTGDYEVSPLGSSFRRIGARFDDEKNRLAQRYGAGGSDEIFADEISFASSDKLLRIKGLRGRFWPASLTAMFHQKVARTLEEQLRFRQLPTLRLDGVIDLVKPGRRTDYRISAKPNGPMDYPFLGKVITLNEFRSAVRVTHQRVDLADISFQTFGAPVSGELRLDFPPGEAAKFGGWLMWKRLPVARLGRVYGFGEDNPGYLTGRFDFQTRATNVRALNGKGILALERGDLVSLPVLGPLSPLI
ncbi:MAG: hypothetical protein ACQKBY_10005, partial [Verrucomicrobiales bacterium]